MLISRLLSSLSGKEKKRSDASADVDMTNIVNSVFNSSSLYDELKVKCHPDRFMDVEKKKRAECLFQRLQEARYDINKMNLLKDEINDLID